MFCSRVFNVVLRAPLVVVGLVSAVIGAGIIAGTQLDVVLGVVLDRTVGATIGWRPPGGATACDSSRTSSCGPP
ncbi:MAG TPA: hypothetical protein VFD82_18715 [Planctomycetota bacterium]|nr:hypothetical protein [Planctomycetota bacterium]